MPFLAFLPFLTYTSVPCRLPAPQVDGGSDGNERGGHGENGGAHENELIGNQAANENISTTGDNMVRGGARRLRSVVYVDAGSDRALTGDDVASTVKSRVGRWFSCVVDGVGCAPWLA